MKRNNFIVLAIAIMLASLLSFGRYLKGGNIKGSLYPVSGVSQIFAISNEDTIKGILSGNGFVIEDAKNGSYMLLVNAMPPYKSTTRSNIQVVNQRTFNVGNIRLDKSNQKIKYMRNTLFKLFYNY